MRRAFVDTSAWYAYVRRDDPDHDRVRRALEAWEGRLVTSNFVFDESLTLIRSRLGHGPASRFGEALRDPQTVDLIRIAAEDEEDAWRRWLRCRDKTYSFMDCTSFALMTRLRLPVAVTTDGHFSQAGFQVEP